MKEINSILKSFQNIAERQIGSALVTLVHVDGSSYRRPGARMLVSADGQITGAISGGCLEGDALKKSILAIQQQTPRLVTYDTGREDDASFGAQLGCAGIIQVLFEPISATANPLDLLQPLTSQRKEFVLVTFYDPAQPRGIQPGTCMRWSRQGLESDRTMQPEMARLIKPDVEASFRQKKSQFLHFQGAGKSMHAFVEYIPPVIRLVIAGAGSDALPVSQMAGLLGWEVLITDGRHTHARPDFFGPACTVICASPEASIQHIEIDERTVFLLMSHNYSYDKGILRHILDSPTPYVGVLGPRKKLDRILDEFHAEGLICSPHQLSRIHGPAGLDLGAGTPEEIALSMISGIMACMGGGSGKPLSTSGSVIHSRSSLAIEQRHW